MKDLVSPISQPSIDKAEISAYTCDCKHSMLQVVLNKGYMDGENLIIKSSDVISISGEDYNAIMDVVGDPEKDLCEQIEDGIWAYLVAQGIVSV